MKTHVSSILLFALLLLLALPLGAQSPNTATMIVVVVDQTGAVVPGAHVSIVNTATGATREASSGSDGRATIAALPLTGSYTVRVSKSGFGNEERNDITLRSGETATLKVNLVVGAASAVTVLGTVEGVRADPQIGPVSRLAPIFRTASENPQRAQPLGDRDLLLRISRIGDFFNLLAL